MLVRLLIIWLFGFIFAVMLKSQWQEIRRSLWKKKHPKKVAGEKQVPEKKYRDTNVLIDASEEVLKLIADKWKTHKKAFVADEALNTYMKETWGADAWELNEDTKKLLLKGDDLKIL